eukprot:Hpha_TRINITY_DN26636_c0_g1::TRINITY_DN26636_c0_g1_i1::g.85929::m.85929
MRRGSTNAWCSPNLGQNDKGTMEDLRTNPLHASVNVLPRDHSQSRSPRFGVEDPIGGSLLPRTRAERNSPNSDSALDHTRRQGSETTGTRTGSGTTEEEPRRDSKSSAKSGGAKTPQMGDPTLAASNGASSPFALASQSAQSDGHPLSNPLVTRVVTSSASSPTATPAQHISPHRLSSPSSAATSRRKSKRNSLSVQLQGEDATDKHVAGLERYIGIVFLAAALIDACNCAASIVNHFPTKCVVLSAQAGAVRAACVVGVLKGWPRPRVLCAVAGGHAAVSAVLVTVLVLGSSPTATSWYMIPSVFVSLPVAVAFPRHPGTSSWPFSTAVLPSLLALLLSALTWVGAVVGGDGDYELPYWHPLVSVGIMSMAMAVVLALRHEQETVLERIDLRSCRSASVEHTNKEMSPGVMSATATSARNIGFASPDIVSVLTNESPRGPWNNIPQFESVLRNGGTLRIETMSAVGSHNLPHSGAPRKGGSDNLTSPVDMETVRQHRRQTVEKRVRNIEWRKGTLIGRG